VVPVCARVATRKSAHSGWSGHWAVAFFDGPSDLDGARHGIRTVFGVNYQRQCVGQMHPAGSQVDVGLQLRGDLPGGAVYPSFFRSAPG
jgi:hypothetical protein